MKTFPAFLDDILSPIVANACKYGVSQGSKVIKIKASQAEGEIIICVQDFGRGIDMNKYGNKLFKAGVRFHSDNHNGQGMGLFISKYIVDSLGGEINVKSQPNSGAEFQVKLPV